MSTIRFRDRFAVRVFWYFALTLLVIAATFTAVFVYGQTRILREQLLEEGRMLARSASRGTRHAVFAEDQASLDDTVQGLLERPDVFAVSFLAEDRRVLAAAGKGAAVISKAGALSAATQSILSRLGPGSDLEVAEDAVSFDIWSPVTLRASGPGSDHIFFELSGTPAAEQVIGFVRVSMDKRVLTREMAGMVRRSLALILVLLLAGSAVVYPLAKKVTAPLAVLSAEAKTIGRTGLVEPVSLQAAGEIGELAESFNTMVSSLKAREAEKTLLETQLMHAQKMEAVGTLARGVAHDFNNILSTVRGAVHILEKKFREDKILRKYTGKIAISLDRAAELINGLITFSRVQKLQPRPLNLNVLLTGLEPVLHEIAGDGVRFRVVLPQTPLFVLGDDLGLKQVLLNLVANARDAMPDGGDLRISIEQGREERGGDGGTPADPGPGRVWLTVTDTGAGMDAATQQRIFEPFFTTKEVGRGTGLGLAIVYGVVEQHNGRITVESAPGRGTQLRIDLPRLEPGSEGSV